MRHRSMSIFATLLIAATLVGTAGTTPAPTASAAGPGTPVDEVLTGHTMTGTGVPCAPRSDGIVTCHGSSTSPGGDLRFTTFDGVPLDVWVTLPAHPTSTPDGHYPFIVQSHGWGAPPSGPEDGQYGGPTAIQWAAKGYAVLQFAARGWGDSCGTEASRAVSPTACAQGYIRLADYRHEIRDVQYATGILVDEGIVDPNRIGVIGESYGGGTSLSLATLNNRVMDTDGSLHPWTSPDGTPLHIAGAVPMFAWSDLATALMPNGRTRDDQVATSRTDIDPIGVWKQTIGGGLYTVGSLNGFYAPAGSDPDADITTWFNAMASGGPYDTPEAAHIAEQITRYRSPFYLLDGAYGVTSQAPAPLFMVSGFTDAIFPVSEALRYYNLERSRYPGDPIGLFFYDGGHQRGQNKPVDAAGIATRIENFMDHYVAGDAPAPPNDVVARTQTCPDSAEPMQQFSAPAWSGLAHGQVSFSSAPAQKVAWNAGNVAVAKAFDPVFGGLACTTAPAADEGPGVATYRLPAATGKGFTLLGAPSITANFAVNGTGAYVAARLLDVDPKTDKEILIARGVYRFDPGSSGGRATFQLEANGWHFDAGHIPKIEILGRDAPFLLASTTPFTVTVSGLEATLPTAEGQGAASPAPAATPVGATPKFTG